MRTWLVGMMAVVVLAGTATAQGSAVADRLKALEGQVAELKAEAAKAEAEDKDAGEAQPAHTGAAKIGRFDVAMGVTAILQQTAATSFDAMGQHGDRADATLSMDVELSTMLGRDGVAYMLIEVAAGDGLDATTGQTPAVPTRAGLNHDALPGNGSDLNVSEVWYQHSFHSDLLQVTFGKIDLTQRFDDNAGAKHEQSQFISGALVDNMTVDFPGYTLGAVVTVQPNDMLYVRGGVGDANADFDDVFEDLFAILEVGVSATTNGREGHARVYAWVNNRGITELKEDAATAGLGFRGRFTGQKAGKGIGVSVDQEVADGVLAFGRWGLRDERLYAVDQAWSVGVAVNGKPWGRSTDTAAVAYNQAILSDDQKDVMRANGINPKTEHLIEAYYRWSALKNLELSPIIQYVIFPNGRKDLDTEFLTVGLRGQLNF